MRKIKVQYQHQTVSKINSIDRDRTMRWFASFFNNFQTRVGGQTKEKRKRWLLSKELRNKINNLRKFEYKKRIKKQKCNNGFCYVL